MIKKERIDCYVSRDVKDSIKEIANYYGLSIGGYISLLTRREEERIKKLKEEEVREKRKIE